MSGAAGPGQVAHIPETVAGTLDQSRTLWREFTNTAGKPYRVCYEIPEGEDMEKARTIVEGIKHPPISNPAGVATASQAEGDLHLKRHAAAAFVDCYWEYDPNNQFHTPAQKVIDKVDISKYKLAWNYFLYLNYNLTFHATKDWYYTFFDQDGIGYSVNVVCTWWNHTVCWDTENNKRPIIEKIHVQ